MKRSSNDSMVTRFRGLVTVATTTTSGSVNFSPAAVSNRLGSLADTWDLFRLEALRFRLIPQNPAAGAETIGVAWSPGIADTIPTTAAALQSLVHSQHMVTPSGTGKITTELKWVKVDTGSLRGALPFYKAVVGAPDAWEEAPGQFLVVAAGASETHNIIFEIEGTITFKGAQDTGSTPQSKLYARHLREKKRIVTLLSLADGLTDTVGVRPKG